MGLHVEFQSAKTKATNISFRIEPLRGNYG